MMAAAKELKLRVIPWTVNEPADMENLIALGVDGIITDYPGPVARRFVGPRNAAPAAGGRNTDAS